MFKEKQTKLTVIPWLLLGEAPAAAGDEGTPRTLCLHLIQKVSHLIRDKV